MTIRPSTDRTNTVWIVEMWINGRWEPTVGCGLGRAHGREKIAEWRKSNQDDKFRLRQYKRCDSTQERK